MLNRNGSTGRPDAERDSAEDVSTNSRMTRRAAPRLLLPPALAPYRAALRSRLRSLLTGRTLFRSSRASSDRSGAAIMLKVALSRNDLKLPTVNSISIVAS